MKNPTTTREIIQNYYDAIAQKGDWQSSIANDITFTSTGKVSHGKAAYLEATNRFLTKVKSIKINEFIVEGNKACVTVEYHLEKPSGKTLNCEVAEVLMVEDDKINSSCIFFDTESFKSFMVNGIDH